MLQEHYAQINANWTRDVWAGTAQTEAEKQWPAVKAKFPKEAEKITWEQYRHYSSLVSQPQGPYKQAIGKHGLLQTLPGILHRLLASYSECSVQVPFSQDCYYKSRSMGITPPALICSVA